MKTKKPRSRKAVKPAARTIRRVARAKPKAPRRKAGRAKPKVPKPKTPKRSKLPARRKPRIAVKAKAPGKRAVRKPRAKAALVPLARLQPGLPVVAAPELEFKDIPLDPLDETAVLGAEPSWEKPVQTCIGLTIPQILMEGDDPLAPPMTGPGQKYELGRPSAARHSLSEEGALPEAYGTGRLLLAVRDPHWLYAHWDLTREQQRHYNALSADRHLVVRVYSGAVGARLVSEIHVHPESRHWFVQVDRAGAQYVAELGYYPQPQRWVSVATSPPAVTPVARASRDQTVRYATIPAQTRLTQLATMARKGASANPLQSDAARERALAKLTARQLVRGSPGSGREEAGAQPGGEWESLSSPMSSPEPGPGGFWFNINADLVIYGATEPGASVTMGGQPIPLRPDGTFSCRCSLPEGDHAVTLSAMSPSGELRRAELKFSRGTDCRGEAGAAPQDPSLKPPGAANS